MCVSSVKTVMCVSSVKTVMSVKTATCVSAVMIVMCVCSVNTGKTLLYNGGRNSLFIPLKRHEDGHPSIVHNGGRLHRNGNRSDGAAGQ